MNVRINGERVVEKVNKTKIIKNRKKSGQKMVQEIIEEVVKQLVKKVV